MSKKFKKIMIALLAAVLIIAVFWACVSALDTDKGEVVCVGDSITFGVGIPADKTDTSTYPAVLSKRIRHNYTVYNYGVSGAGVLKNTGYDYTINEKLYTKSLKIRADFVIIALGTNDCSDGIWNAEEFKRDYAELVDTYLNYDKRTDVIIVLPPPIYIDALKYNNEILKNEAVPIMEKIAEERGLKTVDAYSAFEGNHTLYADGLHLNEAGAKKLAALCYKAVKTRK